MYLNQDFTIKDVFQFGKLTTYAFFSDELELSIQTDKNGYQFFYIKNPFNEDCGFHKSTKNAVNAIRQGYGDMLCKSSIGGIRVRHYIDRAIGEQYRSETIEKWQDEPFDYVIKIRDKTTDSISDKTILCDYTAQETFASKQPMVFDTKEDAENWWNQLIEECQSYAKGFVYQINEQYNAMRKNVADTYSEEYPPDEELTDEELMNRYGFEFKEDAADYRLKEKQKHLDDCLFWTNWMLTHRIEEKYQTEKHLIIYDIVNQMSDITEEGTANFISDLSEFDKKIAHRIEHIELTD